MNDDDYERREAFSEACNNSEVKTREMLLAPHDDLGLVLKCHLIAEDSLTNYLTVVKGLRNIQKAKLSFNQKVELLDDTDGLIFRSKGSLREINKIRNSFGHDFEANLKISPDSQIAQRSKLFLEGAFEAQAVILAKFAENGAEPEQIEALETVISEMNTEVPDDPKFTGDNLAMLSQLEPRELLANFVSTFCQVAAMKIYRHKDVPPTAD